MTVQDNQIKDGKKILKNVHLDSTSIFFKVRMRVFMDFWINSVFSGVIMDEFTLLQNEKFDPLLLPPFYFTC